jgi:hypothetical protein
MLVWVQHPSNFQVFFFAWFLQFLKLLNNHLPDPSPQNKTVEQDVA